MSFGEAVYLAMVVSALMVFAGVLAGVSLVERRWAKTHGRE